MAADQIGQPRVTYQGPAYSYVPPVPQRLTITDMITNVDNDEFPFLKYFGIGPTGRGGMDKVRQWRIQNWPARTVSWLEKEYYQRGHTMADESFGNVTDPVTINVKGYVYREGDFILAGDEVVLVTAVDHANETITVARGMYSTTPASHASGTVLTKITQAQIEGADSIADVVTMPYDMLNNTQIIEREMRVSRSAELMSLYGISDELDMETEEKFKECLQDLQGGVYYGRRDAGSETARRTFGGLPEFINGTSGSYYQDAAGAALGVEMINNAAQQIWEESKHKPKTIVCGGWAARKITAAFEGSVRTTQDETTGGIRIDTVRTQFCDLNVLMDVWCPKDMLYILNDDFVGILPADEFWVKPLAEDGAYTKQMIYGEYTFVAQAAKCHGLIENFALDK